MNYILLLIGIGIVFFSLIDFNSISKFLAIFGAMLIFIVFLHSIVDEIERHNKNKIKNKKRSVK